MKKLKSYTISFSYTFPNSNATLLNRLFLDNENIHLVVAAGDTNKIELIKHCIFRLTSEYYYNSYLYQSLGIKIL